MKALLMLILSFLIALVDETIAAEQPVTMPFALRGDHIIIDATIDGKHGSFALDTGSAAQAISGAFATGLNLHYSTDKVEAMGAGGDSANQPRLGSADSIGIGDLTLANARVVVLPGNPFVTEGIAGTLGYDVFAKWTVSIDFAKKTLTFYNPASYVVPADAVAIPVDLAMHIPKATVNVTVTNGGKPVEAHLMVDTGTPDFAFLFAPKFAADAGIDKVTPKRELGIGFGTNGAALMDVVRLPRADIASVKLSNAVVGISKDTSGFFVSGLADGTMGQAIFQRGILTLDYKRSRILFEPGEHMGDAWDYAQHCGWLLGKDGKGWTVKYVGAGTPAEIAGLKAGDTLRDIDGRPAASLDDEQMLGMCRATGPLSGAIVHDGVRRSFVLERKPLI
jgi:predicted aspartyl protease